jgi:hypothetical protein
MRKLVSLVAGLAAAAVLCVASGSPSYAQTTTFVSGGGQDINPCTLAQPCRGIAHAAFVAGNQGGNGGTVSCLDAGPYHESFDTNFSFTLDCRGVVYVASGHTFAISVQQNDVVTFRHVIFDGATGGGGAAQIISGKAVFEDCTFQNFTASPGEAIQFAPTAAGAHVTITDSLFANNGVAAGGGGIVIQPSGGVTAGAVIERTQVTGNTYGIVANGSGGTALVEVRYSTIANSTLDGIWAYTGGSVSSIVVEHSASVQNGGNGINATGANGFVSLNDSNVAWNATGLATSSGGTVLSYKNNVIAGNLSPGVTPVGVGQQ